MKEAGNNRLSG